MEDIKPITLTLHDLDLILIDIVKRSVQVGCTRLNGYFRLSKAIDWNASNWNKDYNDYLKGYYYSRNFENQGSIPGEVCSEYQAIAMESKQSRRSDFKSRQTCHDFWLNVADKITCEDCPDNCNRTVEEIEVDNTRTLNNVITELSTYSLYSVTDIDGKIDKFWLSEGHYNYLINDLPTNIQSIKNNCGIDICNYISYESLTINTAKFAGVDNLVINNVRLTICDCEIHRGEFDYSPQSKKKLGLARCANC